MRTVNSLFKVLCSRLFDSFQNLMVGPAAMGQHSSLLESVHWQLVQK